MKFENLVIPCAPHCKLFIKVSLSVCLGRYERNVKSRHHFLVHLGNFIQFLITEILNPKLGM